MYNVVFRTIAECSSKGAITWTSFKSKEDFDKWYNSKRRGWYEVVDQGVSQERADELCSTPEAYTAATISELRKLGGLLSQL